MLREWVNVSRHHYLILTINIEIENKRIQNLFILCYYIYTVYVYVYMYIIRCVPVAENGREN